MISRTATFLSAVLAAASVSAQAFGPAPVAGPTPAAPKGVTGDCTMPSGNFNITSFQLYPENADFDPKRCLVYFSVLYNATVAVYDVKKKAIVDTISVRNIAGPVIHASGVQYDLKNDKLAIMLNAGAAFDTQGQDISGDNNLVFYDPKSKKTDALVNLSNTAKEGFRAFQDMEHDEEGNVFVVGSYGPSMLRVSAKDQKVEEWYVGTTPAPTKGLTGVAKLNRDTLLVTDESDHSLYRFSMSQRGQREKVELTSGNLTSAMDGVYLPPKYRGHCLLVSDSVNGTVVLRSSDEWKTAEVADVVPNDFFTVNGFTAASVQIAQRIFAVTEWFLDGGGLKAGDRSDFPMVDITDRLDKVCGQEPAGPGPAPGPTSGSDRVIFPDELKKIKADAGKKNNAVPGAGANGTPGGPEPGQAPASDRVIFPDELKKIRASAKKNKIAPAAGAKGAPGAGPGPASGSRCS
ncbi:hypothetical protein HIM_12145 [Hirsutella minnesotensis 3608]|uniref:SMP-30/Gluconolactonase/LRE-like region domain-containing protein n=1 Tax=Hirsutella minnesotensis 3608 TaxID=1043627 RepID=A0A0F8A0E7_9HYPO|nr:hypothetical protein HIM_12145 [Hirsutella minnesotensis 3608]